MRGASGLLGTRPRLPSATFGLGAGWTEGGAAGLAERGRAWPADAICMLQPYVTSAYWQRSGAPYGQHGEALRCLPLVLRAEIWLGEISAARLELHRAARRLHGESASTPAPPAPAGRAMRYGLAAGRARRAGGRFNGRGPHGSGSVTCESGAAAAGCGRLRRGGRAGSAVRASRPRTPEACQLWLIYRWARRSVSPSQSPPCLLVFVSDQGATEMWFAIWLRATTAICPRVRWLSTKNYCDLI